MTEPNMALQRSGADRGIALAGYALLFMAVFSLGVTGLAVVVVAYLVRDQVRQSVKRHLNAQIGIFWIAFILGAVAIVAGLAAGAFAISDAAHPVAGASVAHLAFAGRQIDMSGLTLGEVRITPLVISLAIVAGIAGLLNILVLLIAPTIGFIRLATKASGGVTAQP